MPPELPPTRDIPPTAGPVKRSLSLPALHPAERAADAVIRKLQAAGHVAMRVGGCVRDRLLGRPAKDADVATAATPEQVAPLFTRTIPVGAAFGVTVVHDPDGSGENVEVATFREETGYTDGRHPDAIRYAGPAEDARRRDFTVNALFYDPAREELWDYTGGLDDLRRGRLRTVGDPGARFAEDSLRLLRAVRFAAGLDFELDPATAAAIPPLAGTLGRVSQERIFAELDRMLRGRDPERAFRLLRDTGLLAVCLPEVASMAGVPQPPEYHPEGDVWEHTLLLLRHLRHPSQTLAWAALLHDVGKPPTLEEIDGRLRFYGHDDQGAQLAAAILERLRAPRRLSDDVAACVANHMTFGAVDRMRPSRVRRLIGRETFPDELELHRLDCQASHGGLNQYVLLLDRLAELADTPAVPPPLLRGAELLALGHRPGPRLGEILRAVQERQLEGELATADEALAWVRSRYPAPAECERRTLNVERPTSNGKPGAGT